MPTSIILTSVLISWPILWAILGGAAALVIALTTLVALATSPRHHARRAQHTAHQPATAAVQRETVGAR
jgi:Na+-driven multidrug efflux pump